VVHLYGQMADMDALCRVAAREKLVVLEDAAQAHGATWRGRPAGSHGRAGCFSFYPAKNLGALGDAGAVVTNDSEVAVRLRSLRDHGRAPGSHHVHRLVGTNSRLDAIQAAILLVKLRRLDAWNDARRGIAARYRTRLDGGPVPLVTDAAGSRSVFHLLVARVPDREQVSAALARAGIGTGVHYPTACHEQLPYRQFARGPLPAAERASHEILSLPMHPHLTPQQVDRVCDALRSLVRAPERPDVA
jgi:dTDP-4-amino-4,6-dideoxygalactose transaminase